MLYGALVKGERKKRHLGICPLSVVFSLFWCKDSSNILTEQNFNNNE